jgi:hypothetical protein
MGVYLSLALASLLFFVLYLFFGFFGKKQARDKYDFLSYFPYEFFDGSQSLYTILARVFQNVSNACPLVAIGYFISTIVEDGWGALGFPLALALMAFLALLSHLFVSLVPARFPREHTSLFFAEMASSLLTLFMGGLYFFNEYLLGEIALKGLGLGISIGLFVLAAFLLLALVNPKLSHWADMKKVAQPDGSIKLERPRPFVMAFTEWLGIFAYACGGLLLILGFLIA